MNKMNKSTRPLADHPVVTAYLGVGSNLDDPVRQIEKAIHALSQMPMTQVAQISSFYRSRPLGPGNQPDYINAAIALHTGLGPEPLLDHLQAIEHNQGRVRSDLRWMARTLDLDILLYDDQVIETERLQVPHPQYQARNFVLLPLFDIAPDLTLPTGDRLVDLVASTSREGIARLNE